MVLRFVSVGVPDINPNRLRLGCGHMENCIVSLGYTQFNKPNLIFLNLSCVDPHTVFPFFYIFTLLTAPGIKLRGRPDGTRRGRVREGKERRELAEKKKMRKSRGGELERRRREISLLGLPVFFRLAWMDPIACEYCSVLAPFHIYLFFGRKWLDSCLGSSW